MERVGERDKIFEGEFNKIRVTREYFKNLKQKIILYNVKRNLKKLQMFFSVNGKVKKGFENLEKKYKKDRRLINTLEYFEKSRENNKFFEK